MNLSAAAATRLGAIDEVIRPPETRGRLAWALSTPRPHAQARRRLQHPALRRRRLYRFRDGLIQADSQLLDLAGLLRQLQTPVAPVAA